MDENTRVGWDSILADVWRLKAGLTWGSLRGNIDHTSYAVGFKVSLRSIQLRHGSLLILPWLGRFVPSLICKYLVKEELITMNQNEKGKIICTQRNLLFGPKLLKLRGNVMRWTRTLS
jgi:hypothetical protein